MPASLGHRTLWPLRTGLRARDVVGTRFHVHQLPATNEPVLDPLSVCRSDACPTRRCKHDCWPPSGGVYPLCVETLPAIIFGALAPLPNQLRLASLTTSHCHGDDATATRPHRRPLHIVTACPHPPLNFDRHQDCCPSPSWWAREPLRAHTMRPARLVASPTGASSLPLALVISDQALASSLSVVCPLPLVDRLDTYRTCRPRPLSQPLPASTSRHQSLGTLAT